MDEGLKRYLGKCSPAEVDQKALDDLRGVLERVVQENAESIRRQQRIAARRRVAWLWPPHPDAGLRGQQVSRPHLILP